MPRHLFPSLFFFFLFVFGFVMKVSVLFVGVLALCVATALAKESLDVNKWNYNTGYTFCLYAYAAYCPQNQIQNWDCKWCEQNSTVKNFKTTSIVDADGELVYVGYNSDYNQIIVSFRGSSNLVNWINNLNAVQTNYPYCDKCKVHAGFWNTWQAVKDKVIDAVWDLHHRYSKYEIVTTGHSLGGALSTLASEDIYRNVSGKVNVYSWTLGSPRVGNGHFADWYQTSSGIKHSQRIVNWKDEVPHLPTEDIPGDSFKHVVQEVWEQKDPNQFILCSSTNGEDPNCSDSLLVAGSISDHLDYFGLEESCN